MSAAAGTKIFGIRINADSKVILGVLAALLAVGIWWNLRGGSDDVPGGPGTVARPSDIPSAAPVPFVRDKGRASRRQAASDRGVLRIVPVDASDGRIDPTLRTDLIARLQSVEPVPPGRSLFEAGAAPVPAGQQAQLTGPKIHPNVPAAAPVQPMVNTTPTPPQVNIPLKYYGFVNPASKKEAARGLFLSGDNILVAKEGDQLEGRFLVVALNPTHARMEDTQMHQGQDLQVTPEYQEQPQ